MKLINFLILTLSLTALIACHSGSDSSIQPSANPEETPEAAALKVDPLQPLVNILNANFKSAEEACAGLTQDEDLKKKVPSNIIINKQAYDQLRELRFTVDKAKNIIRTGLNRPMYYYKNYDLSDVSSGCAQVIETTSMLPHPEPQQETSAVAVFVQKASGERETVYFFKKYFYVAKETGAITFFGPNYDKTIQLSTTKLNVDNLKDNKFLNRKILTLDDAKIIEALNWVAEAFGLEFTEPEKAKFFKDRPFYTTKKQIGHKGIRYYSQLPIVSLYDHTLGFLSYPKIPIDLRLSVESEDNYIQSRAAATMLMAFSHKFTTFTFKKSELVFTSTFLTLDPNFLYELLSNGSYSKSKEIIFSSQIITEENWPSMSNEQASQVIAHLKKEASSLLAEEAEKKKLALKSSQETQQMRVDLAHKIASAFSDIFKKNTELNARMSAMGRAYGSAGIDAGAKLEQAAAKDRELLKQSGNDFVKSYEEALINIYSSPSYRDAYRFKYPIFQLDERALSN